MKTVTDKLKRDWLKKENEQLQKRPRRYLHFDEILDSVSRTVFKKITDPHYIAQYGFLPLLRRYEKTRLYKRDPKDKKKKIITPKSRPISYAAHFDALVYSWYSYQLNKWYEERLLVEGINDSVIAYRSLGKSNLEFAKEVFDFIKNQQNCVAIALDVKGFYDNLDNKILKKSWTDIISVATLPDDHYKVFRSLTAHSTVELEEIRKMLNIGSSAPEKIRLFLNIDMLGKLRTEKKIVTNKSGKGIPQGAPISCVLSNIYMLQFDVVMYRTITALGGLYRRYSDDIMIVAPPYSLAHIQKVVEEGMNKAKLEVEPSKTDIRFFSREAGLLTCKNAELKTSRLQYLGVEFDGQWMLLRHKGYAKFERKMTQVTRHEVKVANILEVAVAKRKLYERFTPLGEMNFVTYAKRAASVLASPVIRKGILQSRLMKKIKQKIIMETVKHAKIATKKERM